MDLTARIRRAAFSRPHPLLVVAPEAIKIRLAVERYVRERGWPAAESAADADVLVVLGSLDDGLETVVRVLETQIPAPWIRVDIQHAHQVHGQLDGVPLRLAQEPTGPRPSGQEVNLDRSANPPHGRDMSGHPDGDMSAHGGDGMSGHEGHGMSEHGGHDMAGHGEHMGSVAGLPMASRAPDRNWRKGWSLRSSR